MDATDSICNAQSMNVAEVLNKFPPERSTQLSKNSNGKDGLIPTKVMPSEVEQSGSTTFSLTMELSYSNESTPSSPGYDSGNLFQELSPEEVDDLLKQSPIIRWYILPFALATGPEEVSYLESLLFNRLELAQLGYGKSYLLVWDLGAALDLTVRYVLDALSQIIS